MTYREVALHARTVAGWSLALLGFALPLSTALDGVAVVALLLAWLVAAPVHLRETAGMYAREKPLLLGLLLFALLLASCLWSPVGWSEASTAAYRYVELALLPAFVWAAHTPQVRRWALTGYVAAIVLNLIVSFGSALHAWDELPGLRTYPHYPIGFRLSITHNFLMSIAAFGLLLLARELRTSAPRAALAALALALACMYNVLFVVIGRTGYFVLAALLVYFGASVARSKRSALVSALVVTALFAAAYVGSISFGARVQDIASDLSNWKPGAADDTSVGQRLGYYMSTAAIVAENPLLGIGAGGLPSAHAEEVQGTRAPVTVNAHNDYLMIAVQAGLPAAALLIGFYVSLWRSSRTLGSLAARDLMRGLVLAFAIGGLFNSFLLDHVEGLLLAWSVGLLYASRDA